MLDKVKIEELIKEQGDIVRQLKAAKESKEKVSIFCQNIFLTDQLLSNTQYMLSNFLSLCVE